MKKHEFMVIEGEPVPRGKAVDFDWESEIRGRLLLMKSREMLDSLIIATINKAKAQKEGRIKKK